MALEILNGGGLAGGASSVQRFVAAGSFTYTPTPGTQRIVVQVLGGGGGGAGAQITAGGMSNAGGGGAGGYSEHEITFPLAASYPVVVGAGGAGGLGAAGGGVGGTSSFGVGPLVQATGGNGGISVAPTSTAGIAAAVLGGVGSLGNLRNQNGQPAIASWRQNGTVGCSGGGGHSPMGTGGVFNRAGSAGLPGTGFGAGGSGAFSNGTTAFERLGGDGSAGAVIVYEFA